MRLKSVWISNYKNLKAFQLKFSGQGFVDIFVGKNGSGKSNFLEAMIEIFNHIYEFNPDGIGPGFDYKLCYEIEGVEVAIEWQNDILIINGAERKSLGKTLLPDSVLVYYSGQNGTVARLTERYKEAFQGKIKDAEFDASPAFVGIGAAYKQLLLTVLLLQPIENRARAYMCEKLLISGVGDEARITFSRPVYARGRDASRYNIDDVSGDRFWKPKGITKEFLDRLAKCESRADKVTREEGYLTDPERYVLYLDVKKLREEFADLPPAELFQQFDNLKTLEMLSDFSLPLTLEGGLEGSVDHFSDGQFQSVYVFAVTELFKDKNCVTLLDEPDAFLHPEWQFNFLKQVLAISDEAAQTNHILMSSHSAATLISHNEKTVNFFDLKDNYANCYSVPKRVAIDKLSKSLIKYTEKEQLLSIINAIQIENKPIFFTEGSVDPLIIKEAWNRLYDTEIPFIPFYGFSCGYLKQLLTDERIHAEMNGLPLFGLFDFDKAYDHWNGMAGEDVCTKLEEGLIKQVGGRNAFGIMLPLPKNEQIRGQVVKDLSRNESFGGESLCEIEHLFFGDPSTADFFTEEKAPHGGTKVVIKSDAQKERFASDVIPKLGVEYFEVFRPIFDFVCSKIPD